MLIYYCDFVLSWFRDLIYFVYLLADNFDEMSKAILGYSDSDLDCLFEHVRTRETNLGKIYHIPNEFKLARAELD